MVRSGELQRLIRAQTGALAVLGESGITMEFTRPHHHFSNLLFQFSSLAKLCLTLCDPMNFSMPGFPVLHYPPEFLQTHVHPVGDAIQLPHPLSPPFPPAFSLS